MTIQRMSRKNIINNQNGESFKSYTNLRCLKTRDKIRPEDEWEIWYRDECQGNGRRMCKKQVEPAGTEILSICSTYCVRDRDLVTSSALFWPDGQALMKVIYLSSSTETAAGPIFNFLYPINYKQKVNIKGYV